MTKITFTWIFCIIACYANAQFVRINESQYPTELLGKLELNPDLKIDSITIILPNAGEQRVCSNSQDSATLYKVYYSLGNIKTEIWLENCQGEVFVDAQNYLALACIRRPSQEQYRIIPSKERIARVVQEQALKVKEIHYSIRQLDRYSDTDNSGSYQDDMLSRKMEFYIDFILTDGTNPVIAGEQKVHIDTLKQQKKENNYKTYLRFGSGLYDPPGEIARGREILLDVYACEVRSDTIISRIQHEIIEYEYEPSRK